jgi:hypothetical protein
MSVLTQHELRRDVPVVVEFELGVALLVVAIFWPLWEREMLGYFFPGAIYPGTIRSLAGDQGLYYFWTDVDRVNLGDRLSTSWTVAKIWPDGRLEGWLPGIGAAAGLEAMFGTPGVTCGHVNLLVGLQQLGPAWQLLGHSKKQAGTAFATAPALIRIVGTPVAARRALPVQVLR